MEEAGTGESGGTAVRKATWPLVATMAMALVVMGPPAPTRAAETAQVMMVDNEPDLTNWHFDPAEITVPAGATVVWTNKGKEEHTVTAEDKSFDSGMKRRGASWQRVFPKPGRYAYYCVPHPWMKGAVRVVAAATAAGRTASEATAAPPATAVTAPPSTVTTTPPTTVASPRPGDDRSSPPTPSTAAPAPPQGTPPPSEAGDDEAAVAVSRDGDSGDGLPGTLAVVLIPTLAGLALGAKLRQRSSPA